MMSALRETCWVVVVRCLHCGHEGSLSRTALVRFGPDPNAPIAAYAKRLCAANGEGSGARSTALPWGRRFLPHNDGHDLPTG